jgi:hypothetical protein
MLARPLAALGSSAAAAAALLLLAYLALAPHASTPLTYKITHGAEVAAAGDAGAALGGSDVPLAPRHETLAGAECVWQLPPGGAAAARGVLLLAHGCSHSALDFWPPSPGCPGCLNLPEEVHIVRRALARGYAVVAISSADRDGSRCWAPLARGADGAPGPGPDVIQVRAALGALLPREGLAAAPLFALGASSGGAFVLALAAFVRLSGVGCQIMALPPDLLLQLAESARSAPPAVPGGARRLSAPAADAAGTGAPGGYPPALFVHMPRDARTAAAVASDVAALRGRGLAAEAVEVAPRPVTAALLRRSDEIDAPTADAIVDALRQVLRSGRTAAAAATPLARSPPFSSRRPRSVCAADRLLPIRRRRRPVAGRTGCWTPTAFSWRTLAAARGGRRWRRRRCPGGAACACSPTPRRSASSLTWRTPHTRSWATRRIRRWIGWRRARPEGDRKM